MDVKKPNVSKKLRGRKIGEVIEVKIIPIIKHKKQMETKGMTEEKMINIPVAWFERLI